jgi:hypothetical protein
MKFKSLIFLLCATAALALAFVSTGCSTTNIENAYIWESEFNSAAWKSQAGVCGDARIDATTTPTTDVSATGL